MFYNYDYKRTATCTLLDRWDVGQFPDILLLFYHGTEITRLELYIEEDAYPYLVLSDFASQDIYLGENCMEWKQMLKTFFAKNFNYT